MLSSLSQSHLALLATCPRKFQHIYLDRVTIPQSWPQYQRMLWGTQFHQLMQQMEMGLPIEGFQDTQPELYQGILALRSAAPQVFQTPDPDRGQWQASEHRRSLAFVVESGAVESGAVTDGVVEPEVVIDGAGDRGIAADGVGGLGSQDLGKNREKGDPIGLVVVYDWVRGDAQGAEILDWKTYRQPPQGQDLAQHWQTRLYCYVLAETSHYEPEQIQFTYWFVAPPERGERPQPRSLSFGYDRDRHRATHRDLQGLIRKFQTWIAAYQSQGVPFPQVPEGDRACQFCGFQQRCQRGTGADRGQDSALELQDGALPEVQAQLQELLAIEEIPALAE